MTLQVSGIPLAGTDGLPWDIGELGGAHPAAYPEPYVVVTLDETVVMTTEPVDDSRAARYREVAEITYAAGSQLRFQVYDEDVAVDDLIMECEADHQARTSSGLQLWCSVELEQESRPRVDAFLVPME